MPERNSEATARLYAALPGHDQHWLALISEGAVRDALRREEHHVAGFSVWALRRRVRRQDPVVRLFFRPRDWTWLVFAPHSPHHLQHEDQQLLAHLTAKLHGVVYVEWSAHQNAIHYRKWPLKSVQVGSKLTLHPGKAQAEEIYPLPVHAGGIPEVITALPQASLLAALAESYFVEHVEAAEKGAFTNLDVLSWDGERPIVIEVKRRRRNEDEQGRDLTLTSTQVNTLWHLQGVGCEVHVAALIVPTEADQPGQWLARGHWRRGGRHFQPDREGVRTPLGAGMPEPTLSALRHSSAEPRPVPPPAPVPREKVISAPPAKGPRPPPTPRTTPAFKSLPRLTSFTGPYAFLEVWSPAVVKLGGRQYQNVAAAFLAARTLDQVARERLTTLSAAPDLLRVARRTPVREDWQTLRETVASAVLRAAYREARAQQLVATLPFMLADDVVFDPALIGVQGRDGLLALEHLRGELAERAATQQGQCCGVCHYAAPSREAGFVVCQLPSGTAGTRACVGQAAYRGWRDGPLRVAVTTPAGHAFLPRSEETILRW